MVLGGEAKVEKEDACECEDDASEQDFNWQRTGKIWLVLEHWVVWQTAGSIFKQRKSRSKSKTGCNKIKTHGSSSSSSESANTFATNMRTERNVCNQSIFVRVRPDVRWSNRRLGRTLDRRRSGQSRPDPPRDQAGNSLYTAQRRAHRVYFQTITTVVSRSAADFQNPPFHLS